jgi:mono/diheme cytochrome c family protein
LAASLLGILLVAPPRLKQKFEGNPMKRSAVTGLIIAVFGAAILMAAFRSPTYRRDVMPILEKNCLACHSPGRVGPMSFATYDEARPWAQQMKAVVTGKKMPPGIVERHYGLLGDDGTLSQAEIDVIAAWADAGAPEGAMQDSSTPGP